MSKEYTLGIIKPDAVRKHKVGAIIAMGEEAGLTVGGMRFVDLTLPQAKEFYAEHKDKDFFPELAVFMCSGPIVVICWEGEDAIGKWRRLMGTTDPAFAAPGTIRYRFGNCTIIRENAVHGSADPVAAERELAFFAP